MRSSVKENRLRLSVVGQHALRQGKGRHATGGQSAGALEEFASVYAVVAVVVVKLEHLLPGILVSHVSHLSSCTVRSRW